MTHLSESEFVELAEGALSAGRASHLDECAPCRKQAGTVRDALRAAAAVDVPEPSPLFWDHFSARVREALAAEPAIRPAWWRRRPAMAIASATAMALLVAVSIRELPRRAVTPPVASPAPAVTMVPATMESSDQPPNDAAWALLRAAASQMELDDAHEAGLTVRPGAVDKALLDLTPAERAALGHLLRDELKRPGA
jgi:hypothetical protein